MIYKEINLGCSLTKNFSVIISNHKTLIKFIINNVNKSDYFSFSSHSSNVLNKLYITNDELFDLTFELNNNIS